MQLNDIIDIISALVKVRKLFWSEDDFKFAFATQLQFKFGNKADVRLEKRYDRDGKSSYTDIVVKIGKKTFPIELKYKTAKGKYADHDGEIIELRNHAAVDLGCYAYLKDIERLEYLSKNDPTFGRGFAIILTNDAKYYADTKRESMYDAFKICEGREIGGCLNWNCAHYGEGYVPSWMESHPDFSLSDTYTMHWSDYSESGTEPMFRYQVAVIERH